MPFCRYNRGKIIESPVANEYSRGIYIGGGGKVKKSELIEKVHSAVYHQCRYRGYAAPVDVLVDIGVLPRQKYEDWRFGKVQYLEAVCTCNLKKLSFIMK